MTGAGTPRWRKYAHHRNASNTSSVYDGAIGRHGGIIKPHRHADPDRGQRYAGRRRLTPAAETFKTIRAGIGGGRRCDRNGRCRTRDAGRHQVGATKRSTSPDRRDSNGALRSVSGMQHLGRHREQTAARRYSPTRVRSP